MSHRLVSQVIATPMIPPGPKLVLIVLASHADDRGEKCHPGQQRIASETGYTDRGVRLFLDELESVGLIERRHRQRARGFRTSDSYTIRVERLDSYRNSVPQGTAIPTGTKRQSNRNSVPFQPEHCSGRIESVSEPVSEPVSKPQRGKPKPRRRMKATTPIPAWLPVEAWEQFEQHRMAIRKPLTEQAGKLAVKVLSKLREQGHNPVDVVEQSVLNGWAGLFPIKNSGHRDERGKLAREMYGREMQHEPQDVTAESQRVA